MALPERVSLPYSAIMRRCSGPGAPQASSRVRLTRSLICTWFSGWWRPRPWANSSLRRDDRCHVRE